MRALLAALALLIGFARADDAVAQGAHVPSGLEFRGGVLAHDVPGLWSGFRLESGIDINAELLLGSGFPILGGTIRPAIGATVNTAGDTSKAYIDARWEIEGPSGIFLGLGLGAAAKYSIRAALEQSGGARFAAPGTPAPNTTTCQGMRTCRSFVPP